MTSNLPDVDLMAGLRNAPLPLIETLRRHLAGTQNATALQRIYWRYCLALAHFQCQQIDAASAEACQALNEAAGQPWPPRSMLPPAERFDAERALPLLLDTLSQLARRELLAFATGGTLLGLTRTGHLLANDKDLDIATPLTYFDRVAQALPELGWQSVWIPLQASNFRSFGHPATGITLDLVGIEYDATSNKILGGWWPAGWPRERGRLLQFSPFQLELRTRGEHRHWVVAQPETLLAEMFGPHWQTPDPEYINLFETPALVKHTTFSHVLGYLRLLEAWLGGRQNRFARLLQALRRLDPADPGLQQGPELPHEKVGAGETANRLGQQAVIAGLREALAQFAENRIDAALLRARQAAQQAARLPLPAPAPSPLTPLDTALAWPLLQRTLAQLASADIHAFAFGGVLLGLVREGRLLANDKDLDIVVPWPQFPAACHQLTTLGWQPAWTPVRADNFRCFVHQPGGLTLDVFAYDFTPTAVYGGWWPSGLPRSAGRLLRFTPFERQQIKSEHGRHWVITHPEAVLAELYGPDWRTPDPTFDSTLETPALVAYTDYTRCWGILRLLEAWTHGQRATSLRRCNVLTRRDPADPLPEHFLRGTLLAEPAPC